MKCCWRESASRWATWACSASASRAGGAENLETFNPAIHIEQLNVNWTPGDRFRNLLEDAVFNLVPSRRAARILLKSIKAGETTVDLTGGEGGGNEANQPTEGQV